MRDKYISLVHTYISLMNVKIYSTMLVFKMSKKDIHFITGICGGVNLVGNQEGKERRFNLSLGKTTDVLTYLRERGKKLGNQ